MTVEIKIATLNDLELLLDWRMTVLKEVFELESTSEDLRTQNEMYYRKHLADKSHVACFAVNSKTGEIVGCGGICYQTEMPSPENCDGSCGYLMNIYTLKNFRHRGIARQIVEFLIADARSRGTQKIYLESSTAALNLYRSIGFDFMENYLKLN